MTPFSRAFFFILDSIGAASTHKNENSCIDVQKAARFYCYKVLGAFLGLFLICGLNERSQHLALISIQRGSRYVVDIDRVPFVTHSQKYNRFKKINKKIYT